MRTNYVLALFLALALILSTLPIFRVIAQQEPTDGSDDFPFVPAMSAEKWSLKSLRTDQAATELVELQKHPELEQSTASQSTSGNWHIECVDCPRKFADMTDRSLQLDNNGHPHVAFGGKHLYHTWFDGSQWHSETIDNKSDVGQFASLALDVSGRPHISYYDAADGNLRYAWHDGTAWHFETPDSEGDVGQHTSLALDGSGRPHISYFDATDDDLKYAWHDGTAWHVERVDSEGAVGLYTSLALDGQGHPRISYHSDEPDYDLKYAWRDGAHWRIETVDSEGWTGLYTSLALDGQNHSHISYRNYYDLRHAWHDGTAWHIQTVDSGVIGETSLALDGQDHPRISYSTLYNLKYAWHDGTGWQIEIVDNEPWTSLYLSLALDGQDHPHISYCGDHPPPPSGSSYCNLQHAWHDGTGWRVETVESEEWAGQYASLAMDSLDYPHISYYEARNRDLKYARYDGTTWHTEIVDSEEQVGQFTSLALDEMDLPHISYCSLFLACGRAGCMSVCDGLKYAWNNGLTWQIETVDSTGVVGWYSSLALDEQDRPHISYHDWTNKDLKYAHHDGESWHVETVDQDGGIYTSLVLDESGQSHISYYANGNLQYAWHDGGGWHIETVDQSGGVLYTSLALDRQGRPHISYFDSIKSILKYAWHDGTAWHLEAVAIEESGALDISLALDGQDRPHISYHSDYPDYDLRYAWRDGATWHIEAVDGDESVNSTTSLALDRQDSPYISYYASKYQDLKIAWLAPLLHLEKQATPSDSVRNNEALTYTLTLSGPGLNARLRDPLPSTVHYVTGSLTGTVAPPAIYSPTTHTITWHGTLPTDTVQTIQFQVTPGITGTGSLDLSGPIVNTAWLTDTESGWSTSATTIVNGWRLYLPLMLRP